MISSRASISAGSMIGSYTTICEDVVIKDQVKIGNNVTIYRGTVIEEGVTIGDNCVVGRLPVLGKNSTEKRKEPLSPLLIGRGASIGAGVILNAGSEIGKGVTVADGASIRERCRIGENSLVGRAVIVENDVQIGKRVKIQAGAYITAYTTLEDDVFIAPMVVTTNDNFMGRTEARLLAKKGAYIKRGARVGGRCVILPGVVIAEETYIAAGSVVTRDTKKAMLYMGVPARIVRAVEREELL